MVINVLKICAPSWSLAKFILRWTVSETSKTQKRLYSIITGM